MASVRRRQPFKCRVVTITLLTQHKKQQKCLDNVSLVIETEKIQCSIKSQIYVGTILALSNFDRAFSRKDGRKFFPRIIVQRLSEAPKMADCGLGAHNALWVGQIL